MNHTKTIPSEIIEILRSGSSEDNIYYLPQTQLDRKTYIQCNEVLENLGGKWNRGKKGHVFDSDPMAKIEGTLAEGETVNEKKRDNFFETPKELVKKMIQFADLGTNEKILEPSAGLGAILKCAIGYSDNVTAIEINKNRSEKLKEEFGESIIINADFLLLEADDFAKQDKIIMNPPFATDGRPQADIDHVLHAYKFLKEGGRLVTIMSAGWTMRDNQKSKNFKDFVELKGFYVENDSGAFKESGTLIKTVTVILDN